MCCARKPRNRVPMFFLVARSCWTHLVMYLVGISWSLKHVHMHNHTHTILQTTSKHSFFSTSFCCGQCLCGKYWHSLSFTWSHVFIRLPLMPGTANVEGTGINDVFHMLWPWNIAMYISHESEYSQELSLEYCAFLCFRYALYLDYI